MLVQPPDTHYFGITYQQWLGVFSRFGDDNKMSNKYSLSITYSWTGPLNTYHPI